MRESLRRWANLAMLGRAAMESLWSGLWYAALFLPPGGRPAGWVCLAFWAVMAVSYGLAQGMDRLQLKVAQRRWIFIAWLVAAGLITLNWLLSPQPMGLLDLLALPLRALLGSSPSPLPFLHLIGIVLLALRGLALERGAPEMRAAVFDFQIGLIFILLYGISILPFGKGLDPTGLEVYLFLGLVTLGATRISVASVARGGRLPRFGPGWAAGLILGAGLVVGLGLAAGALASSQAGTLFARLLLAAIALLSLLAFVILLPLIDAILRGMLLALENLSGLLDSPLFKSFRDLVEGFNRLAGQSALRDQPLLHTLQVAFPILVLLGLLALVWAGIRLRAAWQNLRLEEQEEDLHPAGPLELLLLAERRLARRRLASPARLLAAARIRRIYADLLRLSARLGGERPTHLTPLEFQPRLAEIFSGQETGLEQITAAYLRVRYGEYPESLGEVQEVEAAWKRIRLQARALKRKAVSPTD